MSKIKVNQIQLGQSNTLTQNFSLEVPSSPDGSMKLGRGVSGSTTPVIDITSTGLVKLATGLEFVQQNANTPRTLAAKLGEFVSVKDFGAYGNGISNDSTYIQAAVNSLTSGGTLYFPTGTYIINNMINVPDDRGITLLGDGVASVLKKSFHGAIISLGSLSTIDGLNLDGNGSHYTGTCVIITTAGPDETSWRNIKNSILNNSESYAVEFTNIYAGYASTISNCELIPYTSSVPAIKFPSASEGNNGRRAIIGCWTSINPIVDIGGSGNSLVSGCRGGTLHFGTSSNRSTITGNRLLETGLGFNLKGNKHCISGNSIFEYTWNFSSELVGCVFSGNFNNDPVITDNTTNKNLIDLPEISYTPVWTAASSSPSLGNGAIQGHYTRTGSMCSVDISLSMGTTTTYGAGVFQFSLPYNAARTAHGTGNIYIASSGGTYYNCISAVNTGTNVVFLTLGYPMAINGADSQIRSGYPAAFQVNSSIHINIEYPI